MVKSRIVNVIETSDGEELLYFTLEGVMIGGFKGGSRVEPDAPQPVKEKPDGGIVRPMTPHQIQRQQEREAESLKTPEAKLEHLKNDVA